ncbi:unnamed protein product [Closterium sp. NIES-53]
MSHTCRTHAAHMPHTCRTHVSCVPPWQVDIDVLPGVAAREGVQSVPTFKVWKHGARVTEVVGAQLPQLDAAIRSALKSLSHGF